MKLFIILIGILIVVATFIWAVSTSLKQSKKDWATLNPLKINRQ